MNELFIRDKIDKLITLLRKSASLKKDTGKIRSLGEDFKDSSTEEVAVINFIESLTKDEVIYFHTIVYYGMHTEFEKEEIPLKSAIKEFENLEIEQAKSDLLDKDENFLITALENGMNYFSK